MYCNFYITDAKQIINGIDKVTDAVSIENDDSIIIAITTKPLFSKTEIDLTIDLVKKSAEILTNKKVYVSRSMEVFCDIINLGDNITETDYNKILSKVI